MQRRIGRFTVDRMINAQYLIGRTIEIQRELRRDAARERLFRSAATPRRPFARRVPPASV
jgi:hypothetical protein